MGDPPPSRDPSRASEASSSEKNRLLRTLPSIDQLLADPRLTPILGAHPRPRKVAALRLAVDRVRSRLLRGEQRPLDEGDVQQALHEVTQPGLRKVLNATGVVLHTNLGRAPLSPLAAERVQEIAAGYSNLEFDLDEGERGSRYAPLIDHLCALTSAESALVVNNNAAAVLLVLSALAAGKECIVSRGELVEIGGGFRIPDVMRQSGARLVEVGTTNRTRLRDYQAALSADTAMLVKVHRSNFAIVGFTEEVDAAELSTLGKSRGVPVFEDLGSGSLVPLEAPGLTRERTVRDAVQSGVELVAFSGDKLLGGPQAGIVVGAEKWISRLREHPLTRAIRVDKMTVAALEATLELYRDGRLEELPTYRMLTEQPDSLRERAHQLCQALHAAGVDADVVEVEGQVGGGAMPLASPRSFACRIQAVSAAGSVEAFQDALRKGAPPVIARVADGSVLLDVRCLAGPELPQVAQAVRAVTLRSAC